MKPLLSTLTTASEGELPDFLEPWDSTLPSQPSSEPCYLNAIFKHTRLPLSSHTLWWPSKTSDKSTLLIFIPGNPGLVDFYTPFLNDIHGKSGGKLPILARAHVGHTPRIDRNGAYKSRDAVGLAAQIESIIELVEASKPTYKKIVLVGHSVGSWLVLQSLKMRPNFIDSVFLLFPTIAHISDTPNGQKLSWLFYSPLPRIISHLSIFAGMLPLRAVSYLYSDWPLPQVQVLRGLLNSPSAIYAALSMAHEEMKTIKDVDRDLFSVYADRMHLYFAENDGWVGKQKNLLLDLVDERHRIVHGSSDIPHAFCINHGEPLAAQCFEWLLDGGYVC